MFKGKAEGKITPAYGCQMFWLHRNAIEGLCARLRAEPRPHGLDMYFWSPKFLDDKGFLSKEMMPDTTHPSEKAHEIWAKAIEPELDRMLAD